MVSQALMLPVTPEVQCAKAGLASHCSGSLESRELDTMQLAPDAAQRSPVCEFSGRGRNEKKASPLLLA